MLLCDISLYSVVKQRLKCNTGRVFNCLNQFLLTVVLSIEELVFLVEYVFPEGNRYTDLHKMFANKIKRVQAYVDTRGHHFQRLL